MNQPPERPGEKGATLLNLRNEVNKHPIVGFIPIGARNAVSREYLVSVTGLSDRDVRRQIAEARHIIPIINQSDGNGYYIPDTDKMEERLELEAWLRQETSRLKSIAYSMSGAKSELRRIAQ